MERPGADKKPAVVANELSELIVTFLSHRSGHSVGPEDWKTITSVLAVPFALVQTHSPRPAHVLIVQYTVNASPTALRKNIIRTQYWPGKCSSGQW